MKKIFFGVLMVLLLFGALAFTNSLIPINVNVDYPHQHEYDDGVVIQEASCTSFGILERICFCGDVITENILKAPHSFEEGVCADCGASSEVINIVGTDFILRTGSCLRSFNYSLNTTSECTWGDYFSFEYSLGEGNGLNDLGFVIVSVNGSKGFLKNSDGVYATGDQIMTGEYTFVLYGDSDTSSVDPSSLSTYWLSYYDGAYDYGYPYLEGATVFIRSSNSGHLWKCTQKGSYYFPGDKFVVDSDYSFRYVN